MNPVPLQAWLFVSAILFSMGLFAVMTRRHAVALLLGIELMLNAVNLILVGFSRYLHGTEGQVFVFMIMTVAAAEAAVGLAILVALYRLLRTLDMSRINLLKG